MALYDGFFDATPDGFNEDGTVKYDKSYGSDDFVRYFEQVIGSGVCIHNDPDSFLALWEDGAVLLSPGYLFIQGYWLRNDSYFPIAVSGTAPAAIVAHLNKGKKMIEVEVRAVSTTYPDTLVLALVDPAAGTVSDTRYDIGICGVIDSAGGLSSKVEWAVNYIDNEIEDKLAAAEADIAAQARTLDAKIAEVQAQVDKIVPPPIGSIKFSAAQNVGPEWLQCNGDFISESQYPELVAALGKLTPSADKFYLLSSGEIGAQISNGVLYGGRLWVYSYSAKKLYGVDLGGAEAVKEIAVSSTDSNFRNFIMPSAASPLVLSIIPHTEKAGAKLILSQITQKGYLSESTQNQLIQIFWSEFTGEETTLSVERAFTTTATIAVKNRIKTDMSICVPYVISSVISGAEAYYCMVGINETQSNYGDYYENYLVAIKFYDGNNGPTLTYYSGVKAFESDRIFTQQRVAFLEKSKKEAVIVEAYYNNNLLYLSVYSEPNGTFSYDAGYLSSTGKVVSSRTSPLPLNVAGADKILSAFSLDKITWASLQRCEVKAVNPGISLPSSARVFPDGACYLWGKDIYMIFVGTGIIFSRTLEEGSFGYLDTTSVLGTITQFGYLDYSQDEGTLYIVGQDTTNKVKVAKIVLNTLYDYANDGAWLPMIAADGVPAYIKAKEET